MNKLKLGLSALSVWMQPPLLSHRESSQVQNTPKDKSTIKRRKANKLAKKNRKRNK